MTGNHTIIWSYTTALLLFKLCVYIYTIALLLLKQCVSIWANTIVFHCLQHICLAQHMYNFVTWTLDEVNPWRKIYLHQTILFAVKILFTASRGENNPDGLQLPHIVQTVRRHVKPGTSESIIGLAFCGILAAILDDVTSLSKCHRIIWRTTYLTFQSALYRQMV